MKIIVGIAHHKSGDFYESNIYLPIQVGAYRNNANFGIQRDDVGDNISDKNAYCCEMSATYWIWKNTQSDYKGLFHYRRYLTFEKGSSAKRIISYFLYGLSKLSAPFIKDARYNYCAYSDIVINETESIHYLKLFEKKLMQDTILTNTDIYCGGYIKHSTYTTKTQFERAVGIWHAQYAINLIRTEFPDFWVFFQQTLNDNKNVAFNMLIAKTAVFDEYCNIMFSILEEYHHHMNNGINKELINSAMMRDSGYFAELITDAYIRYAKWKCLKVQQIGIVTVQVEASNMSSSIEGICTKFRKKFFS